MYICGYVLERKNRGRTFHRGDPPSPLCLWEGSFLNTLMTLRRREEWGEEKNTREREKERKGDL